MLFFLWFFYFGVSIRLCAQGTPADGYEEGMIYLKIKNGDAALHYNPQTHVVTPAVLAPIFAQFQVYALERPFLPLGVNFEKCYSIRHHAGQSAGLVSALAGFPFVEFVERVPHDEVDIDCADCPTMPANPEMNYYMNRVRACEAFDFYNSNNAPPTGGALTRVAVVDNAIMTDHEDITVAMGYDVIHNDNNPAPPFEMNLGNLGRFTHGTQVASIVAGNVNNNLGVSSLGWFNQLIAVKTQHDRVNHTPGTPPSAFYAGVAWAAANGAVQVINMSWGSNRPSQMNYNVIVEAWNRGIILVSTAGNIDGLPNPSTPRYPGWYGKGTTGMPWEVVNPLLVLSTAGLNGAEDRHTTSRFGPGVSVSAYGADIRVADSPVAVSEVMPATTPPTYIYAKNNYTTEDGTSMAAPQVSALAGLLWSYNPTATREQVIGCILGTANPDIYNANHPGNIPGTLGTGRIDAYKALRCLSSVCDPGPVAAITSDRPHVCPSGTSLTISRGASFLWSTGQTTRSIAVTAAGTYTATVTFPSGCQDVAEIALTPAPTQAVAQTGIRCNGYEIVINSLGSAFLWSINGGAPFNDDNYHGGTMNGNISYSVTVSDLGGCPGVSTVVSGTLTAPPLPPAQITAQENSGIPNDGIICTPQPVTLTACCGVSYAWGDMLGTTQSITISPANNTLYAVTVTDANGCAAIGTYTIQVNPNYVGIQVTETSGVPNDNWLCEANATAQLSVVGCPGNTYTYNWSTGATDANITVSPATGTMYTVTVTNMAGTTSVLTTFIYVMDGNQINIRISENSGLLNDGIICAGERANLQVTWVPNAYFRYLWSTGATTENINVSPAATTTYSVTVMVGSCNYIRTATITVIPSPNVGISILEQSGSPNDGIICTGTNVILTANSNITGVTYAWSNNPGVTQSINVVPVASVTTYTVTVTSLNGCTGTAEVTIFIGAKITVEENAGNPKDRTLCEPGQRATLKADAGFGASYVWSTGETTASIIVTPQITTTYTVTATNSNGCTGMQQIIIQMFNPNMSISVSENSGVADDGIVCAQTPMTLNLQGPPAVSYQWNTTATTAGINVVPIQTTRFIVTVTYNNGCSYTTDREIVVVPSPFVGISVIENSGIPNDGVFCQPLSAPVTLTAQSSAGVTYLWNTGATTQQINVQPAVNTTYSVTVSSANGCSHSNSINIVIGAIITFTGGNPPRAGDGTICQGSEITLTAQGSTGAIYQWNTGGTNASITVAPQVTTTYTVTASDLVGGCTTTSSATVTVVTPITAFALQVTENSGTPNDGLICPGQLVNLTVVPPQNNLDYRWNTGQTTGQISVTPPFLPIIYQVTLTIGNACTQVVSQEVRGNPVPNSEIRFTEYNSPWPNNDGIICLNINVLVEASPALSDWTYQWNNNLGTNSNVVVSPTQTTIYFLTTTSGAGCSRVSTGTINVIPLPDATFTHAIDNCGRFVFMSNQNLPNSMHLWDFGDNTSGTDVNPVHTYTSAGTYQVQHTVTAICGVATITENIVVTIGLPSADFTHTVNCQTVIFNAVANPLGSTHFWDFGDNNFSTDVNPVHPYANAGIYQVLHTITMSCGSTTSIVRVEVPAALPSADFISALNCRTVTFVSVQNLPNAMHSWDFGDGNGSSLANPVHTYATAGTFAVQHIVSNACGAVAHTAIITTNAAPTVTMQVAENSGAINDGVLCADSGASATISAVSSATTYQWSTGAITSSITVSPATTTTYTVTVTAAGGCTTTAGTTITVQSCTPITGECACPAGPNTYNLIQATSAALPAAGVTNACITIQGTFTVNTPLSITNSTIIMQPGSEIVVNMATTTATFNLRNNIAIRGCGTMWKGIRVLRGRLFLWDNQLISDADYAVNIEGARAIASISRNNFDRNYVSVYVPPFTGGTARAVQSANVINNKFSCSAPLAPKHANQSPVQGNWALAGAFINDQPGITFSGSSTEFKDSRSGIIAEKSIVTVNSATFKNLLDTPGSGTYGFLRNTAVYGNACPMITVLNCKMNGVRNGIRVRTSGLRAENNRIYATASNINSYPVAITAWLSSMRNIRISNHDIIHTTGYGIIVDAADMETVVSNNTITLLQNAVTAIELSESRTVNCSNNTITTQGLFSNNRTAFYMVQSQNCTLIDNFVAGCTYGVIDNDGFMNRFIGNRVDATVVPGGTPPRHGFQILHSSGEYYCDNTTNTSMVGFDFYGDCASSEFFRCSKIRSSHGGQIKGLELQANNDPTTGWYTVIGTQTHTGNTWTNANAFNAADDRDEIQLSQFIMRPPLPPWSTGYNGPPPVPQWFVPNNLGAANCNDCGSIREPDVLDVPPLEAGVAEITAAVGGYGNPISNWIAGQQLYRRLYNQPANIEKAAEFSSFMGEQQTGLMGNMYDIRQQMYRQSVIWTAPRQNMKNLARGMVQKLEEARLLQEAEADEQTIQLKLAEAAWYAEQAEQLMVQMNATFEASVPGLLAQNTALSTPNAAVVHEKVLHDLMLTQGYWKWSPEETPPQNTLASLKSLADQCPFTHGLSVYEARAWYSFFHPGSFWTPMEGCEKGERGGAEDRSEIPESMQVSVFPNPAKDRLTIQLQTTAVTDCHFELLDLSGKCWRTVVLAPGTQTTEIFTHDIPAGLYLYVIKTEKGMPKSGKIVIMH